MEKLAKTPFEDTYGRWCLAGATPSNLLYCISVDSSRFDVHLWMFTPLRNQWQLLVKATSDVLTTGHHYCALAACLRSNNEAWAYLETSENTACLFCFDLQAPAILHILKLENYSSEQENIAGQHAMVSFDNTTGPQLLSWMGQLYVCGSALQDYGNVFRVHRLSVDLQKNTFKATELMRLDLSWQTLTSSVILRVITWRNTLAFVEPDKIRLLSASQNRNNLDESVETFATEVLPITIPTSGSPAFFMLDCCSANSDEELWLIHAFGWSRLVENQGVLSWRDESSNDENPIEILDCCKKCISSGNTLFWVDNNNSVRWRKVALPSLQYACFESLTTNLPLLSCCTYEEAALLQVPAKIWYQFMGNKRDGGSNTDTVLTVQL